MTTAGVPDAAALPEPPRVRWWTAQLGGLPRSFWYLWTGTVVNRTGAFITPFLALYLTGERDVSVPQAGVVLSVLGLGSAIGQPVGGVLADRIGRRRTMVLGLLSSAATLLVLGAATGFLVVVAAAFAYGLCLDLFRPAVQAAVADLVPDADRPRAFALQFWAVNLGFSVATPLGGYLASRGYWLLFVLDARGQCRVRPAHPAGGPRDPAARPRRRRAAARRAVRPADARARRQRRGGVGRLPAGLRRPSRWSSAPTAWARATTARPSG